MLPAAAHDLAADPVDLRRPAGAHILEHRGAVRRGRVGHRVPEADRLVLADRDAFGARDARGLTRRGVDDARGRVLPQLAVRDADERAHRIDRGVPDELAPDARPRIVDHRGAHATRLEGGGELVDVRRAAQLDAARAGRPELVSFQRGADVDDPDRDPVVAEGGGQPLAVPEAVLDREDRAVRGQDPTRGLGRPGGALGLRRDDREVDAVVDAVERRFRPIDARDRHVAIERSGDEGPDRTEAQHGDAHSARR